MPRDAPGVRFELWLYEEGRRTVYVKPTHFNTHGNAEAHCRTTGAASKWGIHCFDFACQYSVHSTCTYQTDWKNLKLLKTEKSLKFHSGILNYCTLCKQSSGICDLAFDRKSIFYPSFSSWMSFIVLFTFILPLKRQKLFLFLLLQFF